MSEANDKPKKHGIEPAAAILGIYGNSKAEAMRGSEKSSWPLTYFNTRRHKIMTNKTGTTIVPLSLALSTASAWVQNTPGYKPREENEP